MIEMTAEAVAAAMEKANRPLQLAEVAEAVVVARVPIPKGDDANTRNVVSTRIRRSGRFHSIPKRGWWFNDRPVPGQRASHDTENETPDLPLENGSGVSAHSSQKGGDGHAATMAY